MSLCVRIGEIGLRKPPLNAGIDRQRGERYGSPPGGEIDDIAGEFFRMFSVMEMARVVDN
jgi:hypothetical protein